MWFFLQSKNFLETEGIATMSIAGDEDLWIWNLTLKSRVDWSLGRQFKIWIWKWNLRIGLDGNGIEWKEQEEKEEQEEQEEQKKQEEQEEQEEQENKKNKKNKKKEEQE